MEKYGRFVDWKFQVFLCQFSPNGSIFSITPIKILTGFYKKWQIDSKRIMLSGW